MTWWQQSAPTRRASCSPWPTSTSALDPATQVFAPLIGILGFAVLTLMSLASLSAIFFLRRQQAGSSLFTSVIAPIGALIALVWVLFLSFSNIDVITGSNTGSTIVISLMVAFPVLGVIASWVVVRRRAALGE